MSFHLTPPVAAALRDWDDRLFKVYQLVAQTRTMPATLESIGMFGRAKRAESIHTDLMIGLITGSLLGRMRSQLEAEHPALADAEAAELLRQFTTAAAPLYFSANDLSDTATARLETVRERFVTAWEAAIEIEGASDE